MTSTSTRRMFIGSTSALGLGAAAFLLTGQQEHSHAAQHGSDHPVSIALRQQMKEAVKAMRSKKGHGEAARKIASTLRLFAAHGRATGLDAQVKATVRAELRRRGRDGVILTEIPEARLRAELREFGFTEIPPLPPPDLMARGQVVDELLAKGITARLEAVADVFEKMGEQLDKEGPLQPVALRLEGAICADYAAIASALHTYAEVTCAFAWLGPVAMDLCVTATGAWLGAWAAYLLWCA